MRPMRDDGTPYPRKRPINWDFVARARAYRREKQNMEKAGYTAHEILHPQVGSHWGKRVVDAIPSADGKRVFVKIVDEGKK